MLENTSSEDIIHGFAPVVFNAQAVSDHDGRLLRLKADARSGDCIPLMEARDPSLPVSVIVIVGLFGGERQAS